MTSLTYMVEAISDLQSRKKILCREFGDGVPDHGPLEPPMILLPLLDIVLSLTNV